MTTRGALVRLGLGRKKKSGAERVLGPRLRRGGVVVLDNLRRYLTVT